MDRVMLITGASSGIGAATARMAAERGFRLVVAARSQDKLKSLAAEIGDDKCLAIACDVTDWNAQQAMVAKSLDRFGQIDVVFANAGFGAKRGFLEETTEHWQSMVLTNVLGPALTLRATIPALREASGHFVVTGSVAGKIGREGSLYSATKWAVTGFAEAARLELTPDVRVTLISPGMTDTPFFDDPVTSGLEPADIARSVLFAVEQPAHVNINDITVRPISQKP